MFIFIWLQNYIFIWNLCDQNEVKFLYVKRVQLYNLNETLPFNKILSYIFPLPFIKFLIVAVVTIIGENFSHNFWSTNKTQCENAMKKEEMICFNLRVENAKMDVILPSKCIQDFKQSRLLVFLILFVAFFFPLSTNLIHCFIATRIP